MVWFHLANVVLNELDNNTLSLNATYRSMSIIGLVLHQDFLTLTTLLSIIGPQSLSAQFLTYQL